MFDLGWSELLVIGVVALIVIGPKDLPGLFRQVGKFTARARSMAREFQSSLEAAADEAGVKDLSADLRKATSVKDLGLDAVKDLADDFSISNFGGSAKTSVSPSVSPSVKTTKKAGGTGQAKPKAVPGKKTVSKAKPASKKPAPKKPAPKKAAAKKPAKPARAKKPAAKAAKTSKAKS